MDNSSTANSNTQSSLIRSLSLDSHTSSSLSGACDEAACQQCLGVPSPAESGFAGEHIYRISCTLYCTYICARAAADHGWFPQVSHQVTLLRFSHILGHGVAPAVCTLGNALLHSRGRASHDSNSASMHSIHQTVPHGTRSRHPQTLPARTTAPLTTPNTCPTPAAPQFSAAASAPASPWSSTSQSAPQTTALPSPPPTSSSSSSFSCSCVAQAPPEPRGA